MSSTVRYRHASVCALATATVDTLAVKVALAIEIEASNPGFGTIASRYRGAMSSAIDAAHDAAKHCPACRSYDRQGRRDTDGGRVITLRSILNGEKAVA